VGEVVPQDGEQRFFTQLNTGTHVRLHTEAHKPSGHNLLLQAADGVLVGFLLCRFCELLFARSTMEAPHGET
jgi:hypothetical protein